MRVWMFLGVFLCLLVGHVSAVVLITEVCTDGYTKGDGDEYILLSSTGSLDGWVINRW